MARAVCRGAGSCRGICNGYYLLFFSVFVGMWILWFASPWTRRQRSFWRSARRGLIAAVPMLPLLLHYRAIHASFGFVRDFGTIREFQRRCRQPAARDRSPGALGVAACFKRAEGELFPGLTIALLVLAGASSCASASRRRSTAGADAARVHRADGCHGCSSRLSAVIVGSVAPRALRHPSALGSNPIKPLTFSLVLALLLALTSPALRRSYASAFGPRVLCGGGIRHVAASASARRRR